MNTTNSQEDQHLPDTGISGLYEVMLAVDDVKFAIDYFGEFGFSVVNSSTISANDAEQLYGVKSKLTSYRMQNGSIDSHGLIRILDWDEPLGPGIGYAPPKTIGMRMAVMRTENIFRLYDIHQSLRENGEQWLPTYPIKDDLYDLDNDKKSFFQRPVVVREHAAYGSFFNHIFFERYGYVIPGYGSIGEHSKLRTSEFTHHDFIVSAKSLDEMSYMSTALGLQAEEEPALNGDWQKGPKVVFDLGKGESQWYQGFVSPNNICGKLKFFIPNGVVPDRSEHQAIGQLGMTLHSFYTDRIEYVYQLVNEHDFDPSPIQKNEFGESSFVFQGHGNCSWQIIKKGNVTNIPPTEVKFELTGH